MGGEPHPSHFAEHPDIPIVVPGDAARIPEDALHFDPTNGFDAEALHGVDHLTVVDDALSHADVLQRVEDGVSVLEDPGGLDAHFPWVTLAVSSFREGALLLRGETELLRSAKNVAVDTVAVGGGAYVGGKVGAAAGAMLGPVGAALGAVAGGVLGAMMGRSAATKARLKPLEDALTAYQDAKQAFIAGAADANERVGSAWEVERRTTHDQLARDAAALEHELRAQILLERQRLLDSSRGPTPEGLDLLARAETRLAALLDERRVAAGDGFIAALRSPAAWRDLRRGLRESEGWERVAFDLRAQGAPLEATLSHVALVPGMESEIVKHVDELMAARQASYAAALDAARAASRKALTRRAAAVEHLRVSWEQLCSDANKHLQPLVTKLGAASERLQAEIKKAGIAAKS